mmetsp:Transcript_21215/g.46031  ORF Transcript_21215/g.46031 Transcript_21215/m.46031 type:complete len:99 (+) Transcript_21215:888-1184(+)
MDIITAAFPAELYVLILVVLTLGSKMTQTVDAIVRRVEMRIDHKEDVYRYCDVNGISSKIPIVLSMKYTCFNESVNLSPMREDDNERCVVRMTESATR